MSDSRIDPLNSFGFRVSLNTFGECAYFQEVTGLSAQLDVQDFNEGGCNTTTHKLLGPAKYPDITLKRGFCKGSMLSWLECFKGGGNGGRFTIAIDILGDDGEVKGTWYVSRAIPVSWTGPQLSASQNAIAMESITFAHEGISYSAK